MTGMNMPRVLPAPMVMMMFFGWVTPRRYDKGLGVAEKVLRGSLLTDPMTGAREGTGGDICSLACSLRPATKK